MSGKDFARTLMACSGILTLCGGAAAQAGWMWVAVTAWTVAFGLLVGGAIVAVEAE